LTKTIDICFDVIDVLLEGLKEKVVFNFETLVKLRVNLDDVTLMVFNAVIDIVNDTSGKLEGYGIKFVVANKDKYIIVLDVNFKVVSISNTTKSIA